MGKRQDMELEAIRLYADGNEIPAISELLGVSENSLRTWKKRAGEEWQDARRSARKSQLADMEDVGSRIRRSREIASQIVGEARDQSALGMVLNQSLQSMLFDLMNQLDTAMIDPDDMGRMTKILGNISLVLGRTEQAASRNQKTAAEIRKQVLEQAATVGEEVIRKNGLSDEAADEIRRKILGIGA